MQPDGRLLERVKIFQNIPEAERELLARQLNWIRYGAGEQIISHLDQSTDVFVVVSGAVRVVIYSLAGREVTFRNIEAGQYFGELAAIDGLPRSATIVAIDDSIISSMSAETFWQVLHNYKPGAP